MALFRKLVSAILGLVDSLFVVSELFINFDWGEAMVNFFKFATAGASGGLSVRVEFGLLGLPVLVSSASPASFRSNN